MPTAENRVAGTPSETGPRVAVVGGGLAGLAVAAGLVEAGLAVELFEARRRLGGRAGSFEDTKTGRWIDRCQHVAMGCCTNLVDFCRRVGIDDGFERHRRLHFFGPDGRRRDFAGVGWLPAPLHLAPAMMRLTYLRPAERWRILRAIARLAREPDRAAGEEADEPVGAWLRRHGQSEQAIARFWSVVLVSALSETLEHASLSAARKVLLDGFLASAQAYELLIPRTPLSEMFDRRASEWLSGHGVQIHRRTRVARIETDAENRNARAVVLADGTRREFDFIIAAVPWRRVAGLFGPETLAA
ncbi:MAG: FAD-dependent oxidoreductase, partial [Planctomycetia bacterium]|nr:FAD-dependent oxidoreductase [Planctomycetia bacterium]